MMLKAPKPRPWYDVLYSYMRKCNNISPTPSPCVSNHKMYGSPELDDISNYSSISAENAPIYNNQNDVDLQSIYIEEDVNSLSKVSIEETLPFSPDIQYGKVLKVINPREIVIASRIYNGYTKILKPKLYRFHIRLYHVPYFDEKEEEIKSNLSYLILNKIVLLTDVFMNSNNGILYANVFINGMNVNDILYNA